MKIKLITLIAIFGLVLSACAPTAVEEPLTESVEQVMEKVEEADPVTESLPVESADPAESTMSEVSFSNDIWPVIEKFALEAHGGKGGVFLENYDDIMKYVVPGNPEESMLYKRLTADGVSQMPPSGPLPAETIQLFYDWIKQGAKNN